MPVELFKTSQKFWSSFFKSLRCQEAAPLSLSAESEISIAFAKAQEE
jgi:hypothetical protein